MNSNEDSVRKELENMRRSQEKLKNSFAEIQTELRAIKSRMNNVENELVKWKTEQWKSPKQDKQTENQMKKKHESNVRDLWDNIKRAQVPIAAQQK